METVNVLMVGMEGAGKTLLLRRLMRDAKNPKQKGSEKISADVVKTAGVELVEVPLGKKSAVIFRELGGCMIPLWSNYYEESKLLAYVIDIGDPSTLAMGTHQLHKMMQDPGWKVGQALSGATTRHPPFLTALPCNDCSQGKAVAVVLNKADLPAAMERRQIEQILMLPVLRDAAGSLDVIETSAWTGEGTSELLRWIVKHSGIRGL